MIRIPFELILLVEALDVRAGELDFFGGMVGHTVKLEIVYNYELFFFTVGLQSSHTLSYGRDMDSDESSFTSSVDSGVGVGTLA